MDFEIPCETFSRLTNALKWFKTDEQRNSLRSVYIEHRNGKSIAVASNSVIMAVENLGAVDGPDGSVNVTIDPALVAQCKTEAAFNSILYISFNEMLQFASAKTTLGYNYPGNAALFFPVDQNYVAIWRNVLPESMPKVSKGAMFLQTNSITDLGLASPTGNLVFPTFIDGDVPVIVRDAADPNWFGVFLPKSSIKDAMHEPAKLPEWVK